MRNGPLNAWLVFIGASPGGSPGWDWNYNPLPSIGGPHPGLAEYIDGKGFSKGIRKYARTVFPELQPIDAYAATMVRNLVEEQAAIAPKGRHMYTAANQTVEVMDKLVRPRLVIALGGARTYTDSAFRKITNSKPLDSGTLFSSRVAKRHSWFSLMGRWETGEEFLYVSPVGIHPSIRQVSPEDTLSFLRDQSKVARRLASLYNEPLVRQPFSGERSSNQVDVRREANFAHYDPTAVTLDELLAMESLLRRYTKGLRNDQGGRHRSYQLYSLTAAHGCPSTPEEAQRNAITLAQHILADPMLTFSNHPKLHYAKKKRRYGGEAHNEVWG